MEFITQNSSLCSRASRHAVRALVELVRRGEGVAVSAKDLAVVANLPVGYLAKVMSVLAREGIVSGRRGRLGGYRLRRRPEDLSLLTVVRLFEAPEAPLVCLLAPDACDGTVGTCPAVGSCQLFSAWESLHRHYLELLERTSLAALAQPCAWMEVREHDAEAT